MTQRKALYGSTALLLALAGTTGMAQADVTAQQVWDNITGFYAAAGYDFDARSVLPGDGTVTVTDLKVSFPNPYSQVPEDLALDVFAIVPSMVLEEVGDGTVTLTSSDVYTVEVTMTPDSDETGRFGVTLDQTGMTVTAAGEPELITYTVMAPKVTATLDVIDVPGEEGIEEAFDVALNMTALNGTYTIGSGAAPSLALSLAAETAGVQISGAEPDGDGSLESSFAFNTINWVTNTSFPSSDYTAGDIVSMLKAGMTSNSNLSHGGSAYDLDFKDGRDAFAMRGSATGGAVVTDMSDQGMSYRVSNAGMSLTVSGSEIPLPEVAMEAGGTAIGMTVPVLASDSAQDMGLTLRLEALSVSDMIWGMLDPGAQLPRTPANIILELAGKGNWFFDLIAPTGFSGFSGGMPGALEAMDINELELTVAGASLTGQGAFTFNMDDLTTFEGIPAPTGALDLQLQGANGLMDKLVAMGLLPQDQAMGARMMMGLFARPGDGEDSLVSKIEVDGATGAISANGQRLQ